MGLNSPHFTTTSTNFFYFMTLNVTDFVGKSKDKMFTANQRHCGT